MIASSGWKPLGWGYNRQPEQVSGGNHAGIVGDYRAQIGTERQRRRNVHGPVPAAVRL
jgi:hypothetical protein